MTSRRTRYTLGDHELTRAISAHHQAVRARRAMEDLLEALGRELAPDLEDQASNALRTLRGIELRARTLRRDAELKHAPQGELLP